MTQSIAEGLAEYQHDTGRLVKAKEILKSIIQGFEKIESSDEITDLTLEIREFIQTARADDPSDWESKLWSIGWRVEDKIGEAIKLEYPRIFRQIENLVNDSP